jgi:hypothetical protein
MLIKRRMRPLTEAQWLIRMSSEFTALPGLTLTLDQARRLWGLEPRVCERLLSTLVGSGALMRAPDGTYRRNGPISRRAGHGVRHCA